MNNIVKIGSRWCLAAVLSTSSLAFGAVPVISGFSPISGSNGTPVTITGANFGTAPSNNIVYFGAVRATVTSANQSNLLVTVPVGATYAPVTVLVNGLVAYTSKPFQPTFAGSGAAFSSTSLGPQLTFGMPSGPQQVAIGDMDGDGKPDLIINNAYANNISLFRNISSGGVLTTNSFAARVDLPPLDPGVLDSPYDVIVGDVDGDGKLDIVTVDGFNNKIVVYRNISSPGNLNTNSFAPAVSFNATGDPRGVRIADIDGDGRPDIIFSSQTSGVVSVLRNIGTAGSINTNSFAPAVNFPAGNNPEFLAVGDLDGDGKPDLAVANSGDSTVSVYRNTSTPGVINSNSFASRVDFPAPSTPIALEMGDIDGDGKADLLVGGYFGPMSVYRNTATVGSLTTNSFAPPVDFATAGRSHTIALADLNGDGKTDIALVTELDSALSLFENISSPGTFTSSSLASRVDYATGYNAWGVAVGDLDGDGRPDIAFGNSYDATISVYQNLDGSTVSNGPVITSQPTNQTVAAGGTASFSVTATGSPTLYYQWYGPGSSIIVGAVSPTLTLSNVQPSNAGAYFVFVTNSFGFAQSSNAVLTVTGGTNTGTAPVITKQPSNQTVAAGGTAFFSVIATGSPLLHYQWYGPGSTPIPGAMSQALILGGIQSSNAGTYFVLVTNSFGFAQSSNAVLTVTGGTNTGTAPVITKQPTNQTVSAGGTATFSVTATGSPTLHYQWFGPGSSFIVGAVNPTLTLSNVQPSNAGAYFVFVTNSFGFAQSSNAVLTVTGGGGGGGGGGSNGLVVPNYCTNTQIHASGGEFNSVIREQTVYNASEFPPFPIVISEIRWRPDQDAGGPLSTTISNLQIHLSTTQTNADNLSPTFAQNTGADDTVVFNGTFHLSTSFVTLSNGTTAFDISLSLQTPFTYDPSKGNLLMDFRNFTGCTPDEGNFLNVAGGEDATSRAYTFDPNGASASVVDTGGGVLQIIYSPAGGSSNMAPVITKQPTNQTVAAGGTASFSVTATGSPTLHYQWYGPGSSFILGATSPTLILSNVQPANAGAYFALVTNSFGFAQSSNAVLTVTGGTNTGTAPVITKQPTNQTVAAGGTASFSVTATGSPTLHYQWYGPGSSIIVGAVNPTLTLSNVQPANAGAYFVFVTNSFGFAQSSNAVLTVTGGGGDTNMMIVITQQPTNQTVAVGGTATFSVTATGSPALQYQWVGPGTNTIVGATNSTLTLSNVQPSAAGSYYVVVFNSFGFVSYAISSNAVLTVTGGSSTCTPPPSGLVAWWKGEGNANDSADGNNGSVTSGITYASGEVGQAFRFDGTNGFISVPASSNLNVGAGNGLTIECWIKPDHLGPIGAEGRPIVEYDTESAIGVHLFFETGSTLYANIGDTAGGTHSIQSAPGTIVTNTLQHVAVTYNKTNGICVLYINGVPAATANFGSITPQTTYPLSIGKRSANGFPGSGSLYNGLLDELSIYNRALSQAELQAIVAAGASGKCTSTTSNLAPVITKQPTNQTMSAGGTASFSVTATGSPTLHYQWYGPGSSIIVGAVNPTLTLSNVQPSNAGSYFVFVTNLFGFAQSSNAVLTVSGGGGGSNTCTPPASGLVGWWKGEGNALDSAGTNNGTLLNGVNFAPGEVGQGFLFTHSNQNVRIPASSNLDVGLGGGLTLEAWINPSDITQYHPIMEWNLGDAVNYFGVHLYVIPLGPEAGNQPGNLYADIQGSDDSWHQLWSSGQTVNSNQFQHVALTYDKASGVGRLYYNGTVVAENNFGSFTPKTTGPLNIGSRPTSPADEHYTFAGVIDEPSVYNRALSSNEIAAIYNAGSNGKCSGTNSNIGAKITVPPTNTTVATGGTATFSVTATGSPTLHYQWYGPNAAIAIPGAINSTLTFSNAQPTNAGLYFVVVSNLFGMDQSGRVMLTVTGGTTNTGPVITKQPTNQTVSAGGTATFSVTATGSPTSTLHYQWFGPGSSLIAGAINPTLTLSNVQPSNAGAYFVFVTNSFGFAQSSNAVLTVTGGGGGSNTCTPPPSGLVAWWKGEGNGLDSAGTNNGTLLGGLGFTNGEVGQAFNFTDLSQGVQVPASPSLAVHSFTIEAWVNPTDVSDFHPILEYGADTGLAPVQFLYGWNDPGGTTPGALFGIIRGTNGANVLINSPGGILPAGQWSHVAMTYNFPNGRGNLYLNGTNVGSIILSNSLVLPQTSLPVHLGYRPNTSGEGRAGDRLSGGLDEVSIYNRDLSLSEIQAIYHAGSSGKCASDTPLAIVTQPTNTTAIVGSTAKLSVTAVGTGPLSYQWWKSNSIVVGATNSTLTFSNVQFSAAGTYHVVVSDNLTSVTSSNATLSVITPPVATVTVVNTSAAAGDTFDLPIVLAANGNENALSFTLSFDPTRLTFSNINLGNGATNGLILPNTNQAGSGIIGVQLALPAGVTFNAGTQQIVRVTFSSPVVTSTQTVATVSFTGVPIAKLVSDVGGNALAANFVNGTVTLSPRQLEGDVSPVPNGNGTVNLLDWVQVGRFVAGLDTISNGPVFQRADCAPRNTLGDGKLTVADWVQAGRYAAGLDPATVVGGPTSVAAHSLIAGAEDISSPRQIAVQSGSTVKGMTVTVPVTLVAQGDETALAFSLNFDPAALQFVSAVRGSDASSANLVVNANQAAGGQVAMVLCLPSVGSHFPAGTLEIAKVTFAALTTATNNTVSFGDQPVARSISDANATELTANFVGNSVIINPRPTVGLSYTGSSSVLSWPAWAGDFTLQAAGSLTPPINWTNVPVTLQTNGNNIQITLPTPDQQIFFRLYHP